METESEAWKAWNVETMIVPGLLQTSAYTDAVVNSAWPRPSQETVEQRRKLRQRRQARLLDETNRLELHAIMHESALIQEIGDDESVMAEQLDHIVEMSEQSNIVVQLIPISRGAYASFGRSYNLLGFDRDDPDAIAVYEETLSTGIYIEADTDTSKYTLHFQRLSTHEALDPQASIQRIATLRARLAS
ncbi:DUF5753 domain-containing protein [Amycolatopsis lurida]